MDPGGELHVRKGQRVKTDITYLPPSIHQSIRPLLIWFPSAPFSAIIADDITTACGAELHLEVKTVLSHIKNTFLFPDPLVRGSISQVGGSIWFIKKASSFEDRTLGVRIETVI